MRTRRSNTIGVVLDNLTNPYYSEVLDELSRVLGVAGFRVVVWNVGSGVHEDAIKAIKEMAVDGVVFTTATPGSLELEAAATERRPVVLINRDVPGIDCDKVLSDNRLGGSRIAELLVGQNRRRVAYISGAEQASTSRDREQGFLERMAELGCPVPEHMSFRGDYSHDKAALIARQLVARADRPDAIVCANDFMAFGALDTLRDAGVTRQECWVIGYDDVEMAAWGSFDLTTVRQPSRQMAAVGARMLLGRIHDGDSEVQRSVFPCELIVRGSTPL